MSKNENSLSRNTSSLITNHTYNVNTNTEPYEKDLKKITNNLTIINQNCKNPNNNKIVILNTPFIQKQVKNSYSDCENKNSKLNENSNKINIYPNFNKSGDLKDKPTTLINDRYHKTSPSLKKIETKFLNDFDKISNYNIRQEKNFLPFKTIYTDSDEATNSLKKKKKLEQNESKKEKFNNHDYSNNLITIQDDYDEKVINENQNKLYIASNNFNNLQIISNNNSFNKTLNSKFIKTKSTSEFDVSQYNLMHNKISLNPLKEDKFYKLNLVNKTFSKDFYTIDRLSSIDNDKISINNFSGQENIKFKLVKKNIRDVNNNRVNSKILRNCSINPNANFIYSQTINTDHHFRSFSELKPRKGSEALNDLTKILRNKSVEKLTNLKYENLELKNTKEGIDIIDKLINNLTRLKTIMIEEEEKNNKEM